MADRFFEVEYKVTFKTVIRVPDDSTPEDEVVDIEIPEGPGGTYVEDSFEVIELSETDKEPTNSYDDEDEERRRDEKRGLYLEHLDDAN